MIILSNKIEEPFTQINQLNPKDYGIRKKLNIFTANNVSNKKTLIFHIAQKSRFVQKDVDKIEEILTLINATHEIKIIIIEAPLCSKAKLKLEHNNWQVVI